MKIITHLLIYGYRSFTARKIIKQFYKDYGQVLHTFQVPYYIDSLIVVLHKSAR